MTDVKSYPLISQNAVIGTVEVRPSGLLTEVSCTAHLQTVQGVPALFARFGETELRLGILILKGEHFVMTKRFSKNALMGHTPEELCHFFLDSSSRTVPEKKSVPAGLTVPLDPARPFPLVHMLCYGILTEDKRALFFPIPKL